uniref:Isoform 2 of Uncharacterized protein C15orf39 homolog n=1 Tax=Mus musculus TaxID=10090 RepID=Q3TEI4-2|nr:unnamed protein product [Mus musculus]
MAEKRPLGPLGPMMYGKLPRLEPDPGPGHSLPLSASSQDSCNYKGGFDTEARTLSPSEPTVTRDEPESQALAGKLPAPKVKKPGRKPPTPGPEKAEAATGEGSRNPSPSSGASTSPPGPTLRARFRNLLENAWLNGVALPTWGHKASGADRSSPHPQLLGSQTHHL